MLQKARVSFALAALLTLSGPVMKASEGHGSVSHETITLTQASVSAAGNGAYTVTMEAAGNLRGLLTLKLNRRSDGTAFGQWALLVAYVQDLNPDGTPHEHSESQDHEDPNHQEHIALVNRGTMGGRVTAATLGFDAGGALVSIDGLQLDVESGSLEFAGMTGHGNVDAANLGDAAASSGSLHVNLEKK
jgi:hypothetical protein